MRLFAPKKLLTFALACMLCTACDRSDEADLAVVPPAIQALIDKTNNCTCEPYIDLYTWKGTAIFVGSCRGPACNCITTYYDREGKPINMELGFSPDTFRSEATFVRTVWSCKP